MDVDFGTGRLKYFSGSLPEQKFFIGTTRGRRNSNHSRRAKHHKLGWQLNEEIRAVIATGQ
ncbi:MAG: hypothetical protein U1E93_03940 [Alphaproteobacteria bacterium]